MLPDGLPMSGVPIDGLQLVVLLDGLRTELPMPADGSPSDGPPSELLPDEMSNDSPPAGPPPVAEQYMLATQHCSLDTGRSRELQEGKQEA
jgi:hypothetical protein